MRDDTQDMVREGVLAVNQITQIQGWFQKSFPDPTEQNMHTQLGVHLEEISEMMEVLNAAGSTQRNREQLQFSLDVLNYIQKEVKAHSKGVSIEFTDIDRQALLDALCDQIVTAVGVAHMLKMDIGGALQEVADSNDSKFDKDGMPIFNNQMKVMKGPDYFAPDLAPFV